MSQIQWPLPARTRRSTVRRSAGVMALAPAIQTSPVTRPSQPSSSTMRRRRRAVVVAWRLLRWAWKAEYSGSRDFHCSRNRNCPGRSSGSPKLHDSMSLMLRRSRNT